ncbi:uncharacterized protein [Hetaerina americana]|uniref:uncharacterized protein n=1 Tax=Hetaerina americana TaxID=62018 RepID=UPI003A7F5EA3
MRVEDKWPFQVQQKRHEMKKRRRGRGYLSTRRAIDRAGSRSGAVTTQGHNARRQGLVVDGEGDGGNPPPQTAAATQGSCGGRVLRSRRYRRPFEDKPIKRLFTPEIKRFLKGWLVRRRENPYPSREEKKELSRQTALTYVQICNWFANWRRKLKNAAEDGGSADGSGGARDMDGETPEDEREESSGPEDDGAGGEDRGRGGCRRTWGNLIRSYNSRAHGNVEQFSITSDDSIWEEEVEESVDVEEEDEDYGRRPDPPSSDDGRRSSSGGEEEDDVQGGEEGCQEDWPTVEHSYSILLDRPKAGGAEGRHQKLTSAATVSPGRKTGGDRKGGGVRRRIFGGVRQGGRKGSCEVTSSSSSSSGGSDCEGARRGGCGGVVVVGGDRRQRAPSSVSKWLESAYAFDERKMNFSSVVDAGGTSVQLKWAARNVTWPSGGDTRAAERTSWILSRVGIDAVQDDSCRWSVPGRHKEELDAAEALARLAATASP